MGTRKWEGPLELLVKLLQAEGEVFYFGRSLALPGEPGGQGEVQVGRKSPQVPQGVGRQEFPGMPTQQKIHEVILLAVHVHQEVGPGKGVKGGVKGELHYHGIRG